MSQSNGPDDPTIPLDTGVAFRFSALQGKTVLSVDPPEPGHKGLTLVFTDGLLFQVTEDGVQLSPVRPEAQDAPPDTPPDTPIASDLLAMDWPPLLVRALSVPATLPLRYLLGLQSEHSAVSFEQAVYLSDEWVSLRGVARRTATSLDVRVSGILWVAGPQ